MTTLFTALNTVNRANFAAANGRIYLANNFDPVKVMIPTAGYSAGITGPSGTMGATTSTAAGNTTNGSHLIRYRYKDSKTGYVSNPSNAATVVVSGGNGALTYTIGAASAVVPSTDSKVDTIVIEMTPVADGTFWQATTVANSAATVVVSIADATLVAGTNIDALYGSADTFDLFSHEVPPTGIDLAVRNNRLFIGGDVPYSISLSLNSGATSFTGTGLSTMWAGRLIQAGVETTAYEIASINSTQTAGVLTSVYTGTTGTKTSAVYVKQPNRIYYSRQNLPESFFASQYARDVLQGKGDRLRAMYSRRDALYLFGAYSSQRLAFQTDPGATTSSLLDIQGNRGVFNKKCLVDADGRLFAWDKAGMYEVGEVPTAISGPMDVALRELVDYSQSSQFHGCYDPIDRVLMWFYVATGDSVPKYAACMELDTGRWFLYQFLQGITASAVIAGTDGQVRAWVGDENGYTWAFSTTGTFDGVPPSQTAVVTVASGSTTSILNVNEALNTAIGNNGASVYVPSTGEIGIISSNTSSAITMTTALTTLPAVGAELWLGSIPVEYRTKWWEGEGRPDKKSPDYFYMSFYPGSTTGQAQVYFYADFSLQPETYSPDASYNYADGVSIVNGVLTIQTNGGTGPDGFIPVPQTSDWARALQARVTSQRPDGAFRMMDMGFKGAADDEVEDPTE